MSWPSIFDFSFSCAGISTLIAKGVYDAAFPLHDVSMSFRFLPPKIVDNGKKKASDRKSSLHVRMHRGGSGNCVAKKKKEKITIIL